VPGRAVTLCPTSRGAYIIELADEESAVATPGNNATA
jgi:hypothetical protein